jgi:retinol dehydrogenase-12
LGYETVLHFARSNASRIIIASRNLEKCQTAARKVYSDVPSYRGKVDVLQLDLSSFDSVKSFCKELNDDKDRLDYVIANAGVSKAAFKKTGDGYEETMQVNGLSTALMGLLLLPKLEETAGREVPAGSKGLKPTMVIVASEGECKSSIPVSYTRERMEKHC